ncbi:MDR family MFS transporter [Pseudomonas sp.]|uniref:MDR family MFS transporter n=1 Tax=Pseudomonas sp. TaxID=306 RepID=UPI0028AD50B7|nr:MDR family MFS transporter [Pseudomonas sp.]
MQLNSDAARSDRIKAIMPAPMLAILLAALDQTIVAVSLPAISAQLNDTGLLAWVISGYMVAMTVSMPLYGKFGDLYGRQKMMSAVFSLFTVASLACALAQDMPQLILARLLQGLGAGGLIAVSQAVIGDVVPPRERGRYQGYISSIYALASIAGPVLGGLMTEYLSWRWVFWINLPLGIAGLFICYRVLTSLPVPGRKALIDYPGILLLATGLTALLMATTLIGKGAPLSSGYLLWLAAAAITALTLFAYHEQRAREPLLPLRLLRNRTAGLCCMLNFLTNFQAIGLTLLIPLWFQAGAGHDMSKAALHLIPFAAGIPLGAFTCGRLTAVLGRYKPQILVGTLIMPCALVMLAFIDPRSGLLAGGSLFLAGLATGIQFPTALVAAQNAVPQADIGVMSSTISLFRSLGGAVGAAGLSALLLLWLPPMQGYAGSVENVLQTYLAGSAGTIDPLRQTLLATFHKLFLVSAGLSLLALACALSVPERPLRGRTDKADR